MSDYYEDKPYNAEDMFDYFRNLFYGVDALVKLGLLEQTLPFD